jgi:uncharacterized caspase-like protein
MTKLLYRVAGFAIVTLAVIGGRVDAWAERRVALVVGNSAYKYANASLPNPRNDAGDISAALKTLGFEVKTTVDASKRDIDLALADFARRATDADAALFFYAGHAMQFQGRNYLMPTDAELEDEISVRYQMVGLQDVTAALDRASGVKIMILDACRNNPLADRLQKAIVGASRSVATTRGLARIDKAQGMVVTYATAADEVAQDGQGRNSPFTTALLKRLQEPGVEIETMFKRVRADVNAQTGGRQRPETTSSLLSEYYLNQNDRIAWDGIKDQDDMAALRDFVSKYRSSPLAIFARNRLELLERHAKEREEIARRAREEEQRRLAEAEAQQVARERREAEERLRTEQLAAQKRIEEGQRRQEAARLEATRQEEQKRQEAARLEAARQEEQKRQEAARLEAARQEEQKRQEAARLEAARQEEQKRQEAARLEAARQEEQKRQEAARLEAGRQEDRKQQDELKRLAALQIDAPAPKMQPALTTPHGVTTTPQATKANLPEQIRQAQTELRRLGCFHGNFDGKMSTTEKAIREFLKASHKRIFEIDITDDFVADLQRQPRDICPPPSKKSPTVANLPPAHNKGAAPVSREPAQSEARQPPPPPQPARNGASLGTSF